MTPRTRRCPRSSTRSRLAATRETRGDLLQFPFYFRNTEETRARVAKLAEGLQGWPAPSEVRDRTWLLPAALEFLRERGLSLSAIDICQTKTSIPPGAWTTGPLGYVRFHGRNRDAWFDSKATVAQKYDYLYSLEELNPWAVRVREIAQETEATYVIMNNHFAGKAVANALPPPPPPRASGPRTPPIYPHDAHAFPQEIAAPKTRLEERGFEFRSLAHAHFQARAPGVVVSAYRSGKVVVQGAAAMEMFGDMAPPAPKLTGSVCGSDESGKGDYFETARRRRGRREAGQEERCARRACATRRRCRTPRSCARR